MGSIFPIPAGWRMLSLAAMRLLQMEAMSMNMPWKTASLAVGLAVAGLTLGTHARTESEGAKMKILRCTPIQIVEAIEPNLEFWEGRLGYKKTAEVPPGAKQLDFVILEKDGLEVMLQTLKSIEADMSSSKTGEHYRTNQTILYIEVDSLE